MQMLLGQTGGATGPSKNEIDDGATTSPWTNLLSVGLRVLTALLGGPQQPVDGIDKVDNQSSPMQVSENNCDALRLNISVFEHFFCEVDHVSNANQSIIMSRLYFESTAFFSY